MMETQPQLRDYQASAISAIQADWQAGTLDVLMAHPTGLGKTVTAAHLLRDEMTCNPQSRAIFVAHRDELIVQPQERFGRWWPESMLFSGVVKAARNEVDARLIFASIQTVSRPNRLQQLIESGPFDYLIYDECHHSTTETGQRFIEGLREANPGLKHLGMSATPWRADGAGMITVYEKISDQRNIRWAIKNGWLVPVEGLQVETGVDISSVPLYHGDFATGTLGDVLDAASWHELVADAYLEHAQGKQTIAFTPRVSNSLNLRDALVERGIAAAHVDATTPREERRAIMRKFRSSEIQVLCNVGIVSEGFDAPSANCIMLARPTKSHGWFTQAIGRGLRIYPGKEKCLVLLFMTTGAHILTLHDLGESKKLKEAKEKDELLTVEGVSSPIPLFDDMAFDGVGLYAKAVDLFGSSKGAWFRDGATFSLALGESSGYDRTLVILPPNNGDNWRLMGLGRKLTSKGAWADKRKAKYGPWNQKILEESPDVEDLMIMATGIIERVGADIIALRSKKWRKDPASAGQLRYARKWASADVLASLTKGEVAQIITHGVAVDLLRGAGLT